MIEFTTITRKMSNQNGNIIIIYFLSEWVSESDLFLWQLLLFWLKWSFLLSSVVRLFVLSIRVEEHVQWSSNKEFFFFVCHLPLLSAFTLLSGTLILAVSNWNIHSKSVLSFFPWIVNCFKSLITFKCGITVTLWHIDALICNINWISSSYKNKILKWFLFLTFSIWSH